MSFGQMVRKRCAPFHLFHFYSHVTRGAKRVELVASDFVGTHRGVKKVVVVHAFFYFITGCVSHVESPNKTKTLVHLNIRFEAIDM